MVSKSGGVVYTGRKKELPFGDKVVLDLPTVQPSTQVSPAELTWESRIVNATLFAGTLLGPVG